MQLVFSKYKNVGTWGGIINPALSLGKTAENSQSIQDVNIDLKETKFFKHFS